ncbi:MAG TPA: ABC transporter permease [Solirubrobacteraceae bacterium]|nr:ABC transporter permease [Solirubrobacteraceae bacterium]
MSVNAATVPGRPSRSALRALVVSEGKLAWREPVGLVLGVGVPVMLLVIFGLSSGFQKRIVASNPTTYRTVYVPILMALVLVLIALISLPIPIVVQRERKFLRRLSTTPVAPLWLLAAQVAVNLVLALVAMVLIIAGSALLFDVHAPSQVPGFMLAALLATACLFAIGLVIAAVAPSERAAGAIGSALLFPLMFFAGLWQPSQTVTPSAMHTISNLTPLGAAVHAMLRAMQGSFPTIGSLAVMAAWAVVFGIAAVKLFRWE